MGRQLHLGGLRRGLAGVFYIGPGAHDGMPASAAAMRLPATVTGSGRRMSYEEGLAQQILQMNQTIARTNHLAPASGPIPFSVTRAGEVRVQKSAAVDMPSSGRSYRFTGIEGQASAAVLCPAIGATATVIQFTVPLRMNGTIEFIANQFVGGGWTEGTGDLIWQLLADAVPIKNYEYMSASLGSTGNPGNLGRSFIRISEGQFIQLRCRNVNVLAAGQPLLGLLGGHFYPIEEEEENSW